MPTPAELSSDPRWLPEGYDAARDVVRFARIDRAGLVKEAFLDQRMAGSVTARAEAPLSAFAGGGAVPSFIFHSAFCCSTLLARALDAPGFSLALKEPNILLDLANAARVNDRFRREPAQFEKTVKTVFALLARPHVSGERVVVKPTNTAATLAPLALKLGAPCLFLYGDLREFLVSLLKKGEEGRSFVRQQFNIYALDGTGLAALPQRQAMTFTDLQVATVVWRHQLEQFQRYVVAAPKTLAASLDFQVLLNDGPAALKSSAKHLRLPTPAGVLENVAISGIFTTNSKFGDQKYDAKRRRAEEDALSVRWKVELDLMARWAEKLSFGESLRLPLPLALSTA
jgi:hypothetical protein